MPTALIRRFAGVQRRIDPAFLGPEYLVLAQNWVPSTAHRLQNRPGTTTVHAGTTNTQWTSFVSSRIPGSLVIVGSAISSGVSRLWRSTDGGATFTMVTNGAFATAAGARGVVFGASAYFGNGIDPIKRIAFSATSAQDLSPVATFNDTSAAPTAVSDTDANLPSGTYSYCWAIYDSSTRQWVARGQARQFTLRTGGGSRLSFPIVSGQSQTLGTGFQAHLFVTPPNLPIEHARDQTPEGVTSGATEIRSIVLSGERVPLAAVTRTGLFLVAHRNRLWVAGAPASPTTVDASAIILRTADQPFYNIQEYFPASARLQIGHPVTGMAVAGLSGVDADTPKAPLVITTLTRTFLFYGDIIDDPNADLIEVSSSVGCVWHDAICSTPHGVFFVGLRSVYRIPPGGGPPEDVGWPIADEIAAMSPGLANRTRMFYHKGFLKIALAVRGATAPTTEWWLDLRSPSSVPSWWGPHSGVAPTATLLIPDAAEEVDRALAAVDGTSGRIVALHQPSSAVDNTTPIVSTLLTGTFDGGEPFTAKQFLRVRAIGQGPASVSLHGSVLLDDGPPQPLDGALEFRVGAAEATALWNTALWNTALWGTQATTELQGEVPATRARALGAQVLLSYTPPMAGAQPLGARVELRDIAIDYTPVVRAKRAKGMGGIPPAGA